MIENSSLPKIELKDIYELNKIKQHQQQQALSELISELNGLEKDKRIGQLSPESQTNSYLLVNEKNLLGSSIDTTDVIYDEYRHSRNQYKHITVWLILISVIVAIGAIVIISLVSYDEYIAFNNQRFAYLNPKKEFCNKSQYGTIDVILTPIGAFVIFLFVLVRLFETYS